MKRAVATTTLLVALLAIADALNPVREGLNATYYANTTRSGAPAVSTRDPQLTKDRLIAAWRGAVPAQFSVTWAGSLMVPSDGSYALATISDDESAVFVDGERVVDNGGRREWPRGATGLVTLTRGVHAIYVQYVQDAGPFHIDLLWARAGQPLQRVPSWALTPRRVGYWAFAASAGLKQTRAIAEWLWVATIVVCLLTFAWTAILNGKQWLVREGAWPAMRWILAVSLLLNLAGIWWGLPGGSWMADELTPSEVMGAAAKHFGQGWFDRYPPFHFYVLGAAYSPVLLLEWLGRVDTTTLVPYTVLALVGRMVSVAAAVGILLAAYASGARVFGRRAGLFAAAMFALVAPFVYYAKSANLDVPYLFWFALSLVFYLRALEELRPSDVVAFAACGMVAICTKDQAYGLYVLPPFAIVHRIWQANRKSAVRHPLIRALVDRRLLGAAGVASLVFLLSHNVVFNAAGFRDHVLLVTGPASETYRDFEPTLAGHLGLLRVTGDIIKNAWGWPMIGAVILGVGIAFLTRRHRRAAVWLALPIVSYYVTFLNVVLYNYDRFMLPVCFVLSLFGGLAFDRWLPAPGRFNRWRTATAGLAMVYTLLYASTVDLVMVRDSRYVVEQWLADRVGPGDLVGYVFPLQYYPRLDRFNHSEIASVSDLKHGQPRFYVLDEDYARAEASDSPIGELINGLQNGKLGYTLAFRYRRPALHPWVPGSPPDLMGDRTERPITSVLRHINPTYQVFTKGS